MLQPETLAIWCSAFAAVTFTAIWLLIHPSNVAKSGSTGVRLEGALLATASTAAFTALAGLAPGAAPIARLAALLEPLAWTLVLAGWTGRAVEPWDTLGATARRLFLLVGFGVLLAASLEPAGGRLHASLRAALALLGLAALVALLRRLDDDEFWKLKYLLAAVAALLFLHVAAAVGALGSPDGPELGRALLTLLAAPLVLISLRRVDETAAVATRGRAMASGALLAALVTVYGAAVGWLSYEVRAALPADGAGVALAGGLAAVLALALVLASGSVQALLRRLFGRMIRARFDYEREWLRFIETVGASEAEENLPLRVIRAVGEAVDATGGAVWLRTGRDRFELQAIRNLDRPSVSLVEAPGLAELLGRIDGPLELDRLAAVPDAPAWPDWLPRPPRGWLVLPLVHRGTLSGLMVLAEPRAARRLGAEERRLLRILAREAASYLAEDRATRALAEARQFTDFSRRFAFLTHDLKSLVAELDLAAANARRHIDDPAFRADLLRTLDDAVARLRELLEQLRRDDRGEIREVDLVSLLARARGSRPYRRPRLAAAPSSLVARVDTERLLAAVRHLIDNGFEATQELGPVELGLRAERGLAVIEVRDRGPGIPMAAGDAPPFRPFVTTKPEGLGLGLVAARDLAESLGGRLEVESRPGRGTTARILLPRFEAIP
ncbi:MAG: PEP-CTERM system histidine kinase PrsK [Geminicoccaceae bacterium]|nr:PEP-CTERM system histidine kinase PrsK [Geminicoccaceae bacterium]